MDGFLAEFKDKAEESNVASFFNINDHLWIGLKRTPKGSKGLKKLIKCDIPNSNIQIF